jgi:hypothetical protein
MTALEREKRDERNRKVKGEKALHIVDIGVIPHNKSYFCIRETASGYYVQSFETIVLYVSKNSGRITRTWNSYTRATTCHINYALNWIEQNTQTKPERLHLSSEKYCRLPYRWVGMEAA